MSCAQVRLSSEGILRTICRVRPSYVTIPQAEVCVSNSMYTTLKRLIARIVWEFNFKFLRGYSESDSDALGALLYNATINRIRLSSAAAQSR